MRKLRRLPAFSASWDEGRYFDAWMIVHFLSGAAGGFSNVIFHLSTRGVYALGIALLIVWELLEWLSGVRESAENRLIDIVVGTIGITVALWVAALAGTTLEWAAFGLTTAGVAVGNVLGWIAYRRRMRENTAR